MRCRSWSSQCLVVEEVGGLPALALLSRVWISGRDLPLSETVKQQRNHESKLLGQNITDGLLTARKQDSTVLEQLLAWMFGDHTHDQVPGIQKL